MKKPADLMVLRKSKKERAAQDGAAFMVAVNAVFNGMIDQLREVKRENQILKEKLMSNVLNEIAAERERQIEILDGRGTPDFDNSNSRNDWIAYVNAYTGRAAEKVFRNETDNCQFRENMVKAAALCVAAIEAHDKGYC